MLPGLSFPNVREVSVREIWNDSPAFNAYRGEAWMRDPCRSCPERTKDFGGCRCQAFMLTGEAENADPVCALSPNHHVVTSAVERAQTGRAVAAQPLIFRERAASAGLISSGLARGVQ